MALVMDGFGAWNDCIRGNNAKSFSFLYRSHIFPGNENKLHESHSQFFREGFEQQQSLAAMKVRFEKIATSKIVTE